MANTGVGADELFRAGACRTGTASAEPATYGFRGAIERSSLVLLLLLVVPPMPMGVNLVAFDACAFRSWPFCRGRERSKTQTKHAGKRQYRFSHGLCSTATFVTCPSLCPLLYLRTWRRTSHRYESARKNDGLGSMRFSGKLPARGCREGSDRTIKKRAS